MSPDRSTTSLYRCPESGHACTFDAAIVRTPSRSIVDGLRAAGGDDPDYEAVVESVTAVKGIGFVSTRLMPHDISEDAALESDTPAVRATHTLLREALLSRASDIHLEADLNGLRLRLATLLPA